MSLHIFRTGLIAFCAGMALLCASCATAPKSETEKTPAERAQLLGELGTQAMLRGDHAQAIEDLRKSLLLKDDSPEVHNNLALAYLGLGQRDLARKELKKALEIDHMFSDAHVNLGTFASEEGKFELAKNHFRKALENLEYKFRHRPLTALAQLAIRENNIDEARQLLYKSVQANPEYCLSRFLMGSLYSREGNYRAAAQEFRKSVREKCASNVEGHYQLGLSYVKLKDYSKAKGEFLFLVDQFPQTVQAQQAGDQLRNLP